MAIIHTTAINDRNQYCRIICDDEDYDWLIGTNWTTLVRSGKTISGHHSGFIKKKFTLVTTMLRTKYERIGICVSQLTRIEMPKTKIVVVNKIEHELILSRDFDFRKSNLICRQSCFPTEDMTYEDYIIRYKTTKGENLIQQLWLPGMEQYPVDRQKFTDTIQGPRNHVEDCFNGTTIPGVK